MVTAKQDQRQSVARTMLEAGLSASTVALRLQVRFQVSRATAHRDVAAASAEIQQSDDGPAADHDHSDHTELLAAILYDASLSLASGNYADAAKLISAADKVKRWHGGSIAVPADDRGTA